MKRNYNHINTLDDLHLEITRLKANYQRREVLLKDDTKQFIKQFSLKTILKKHATPSALLRLDKNTHITSKVMAVALPMLLNSTLFKKSGVVTRAFSALISGNVGKSLDAENLSGAYNILKSLFSKKTKKKRVGTVDYGIPPDSETY